MTLISSLPEVSLTILKHFIRRPSSHQNRNFIYTEPQWQSSQLDTKSNLVSQTYLGNLSKLESIKQNTQYETMLNKQNTQDYIKTFISKTKFRVSFSYVTLLLFV